MQPFNNDQFSADTTPQIDAATARQSDIANVADISQQIERRPLVKRSAASGLPSPRIASSMW